jgi:hypothetical protein
MLLCVVIYFVLCCQYITRAREKGKFFKTNEMWNFIKNLLAMQLGILSFIALKVAIFRWVWLVFAVGSACFQYFWDICMDWHFFEPGARYKFLRNDLGYNKPCIYYAMVIANIFLRVVWTVKVSPNITFAFNVSHV